MAITINTINMLIVLNSHTIYEATEDYLEVLLKLTSHESEDVRNRSLQGITTILDFRLELVIKHHEIIFDVLLNALNQKGKTL